MRQTNSTVLFFGIFIVVIGLLLLAGSIFQINTGQFCLPVGLILLGAFLLIRPRIVPPNTAVSQKLLGEIERSGPWQARDEEYWVFVGDLDLDLTQADIPLGETRLRLFGFVCDTDIIVPSDVGVSVSSTAFVSDLKLWNGKREAFLAPAREVSENWETAERKLRIEAAFFVADVDVRRV